jgi:hypothetical protein
VISYAHRCAFARAIQSIKWLFAFATMTQLRMARDALQSKCRRAVIVHKKTAATEDRRSDSSQECAAK